jgi:hypothetical protein
VEQVKGEGADRARIAERVEEKLGDLPHHGWRGLLLLQRLMRLTEPKVADQRIRRSAGRAMRSIPTIRTHLGRACRAPIHPGRACGRRRHGRGCGSGGVGARVVVRQNSRYVARSR